jgi:DNA (cytosine-5)-methyltransferase 1
LGADFDGPSLQTYARNVHDGVVLADLADAKQLDDVIRAACRIPREPGPLFVLGGPPCQGFSTAGKRRSMDDRRNHLFRAYARALAELVPDGFLFENVPGLLNMEGGATFRMIRETLSSVGFTVRTWDLHAHHYGVPQRRRRIILLGVRDATCCVVPPSPLTSPERSLFEGRGNGFTTVGDAIEDLPALEPGEDGSTKGYASEPLTLYQSFMRGTIGPGEYLDQIGAGTHA